MPVLTSLARPRPAVHFRRVYVPLGTLITAWEFLRTNGSEGREQLCFLAGRVVDGAAGPAAQVTSCVLPVTVATPGYVTLTSHAQAALILDSLEERNETPIFSIHTHGDGGAAGWGPEHSTIDDHGVTLGPEDGVFSAVVPYYALGSPFGFPHQVSIYERVGGAWQMLSAAERAERVIVHGDTVRLTMADDEEGRTS